MYIIVGVGSLLAFMGLSYFVIRRFEINIRPRTREENEILIEADGNATNEETENQSRSRIERFNDVVRFIRKRSPRPTTLSPESTYI